MFFLPLDVVRLVIYIDLSHLKRNSRHHLSMPWYLLMSMRKKKEQCTASVCTKDSNPHDLLGFRKGLALIPRFHRTINLVMFLSFLFFLLAQRDKYLQTFSGKTANVSKWTKDVCVMETSAENKWRFEPSDEETAHTAPCVSCSGLEFRTRPILALVFLTVPAHYNGPAQDLWWLK